MIHTAMQMKNLIRNKVKKTGAHAQPLLRKFMMERFMECVSVWNTEAILSQVVHNQIIKLTNISKVIGIGRF
jgi:hypothetical protein